MQDPEVRKFYCPTCHTDRTFRREKVNHRLHLVLSIVTGGLWLVSWIALILGQRYQTWTCGTCDQQQVAPPKAPPKW